METILAVALFAAGIALIVKGGDYFVDAAGWTSDVTGISKVVIGATIVSFATTSPEYFVSTIATLKGYNDLSIGNAVGSLSANLGIAFALLAILTPGLVKDRLFGIKGLLMIIAAGLLFVFCLNGAVSNYEAAALLLLFVVSVYVNIRYSRDGNEHHKRIPTNRRDVMINIAKFVGGAAAVIFGSNLVVDNGKMIAGQLGVSDAVIGLTFVAVGTSLPEVATSVTAIIKKQNALSIGNIIGANIMDTTLILATGAFISNGNLTVSQSAARVDIPLAIALMLMAVLPTAIGKNKKIYRWQGAIMAATYLTYIVIVAFF